MIRTVRRAVRRTLVSLFGRRRLERELDDEMDFHLDMETRARIAAGASPEEARRQARAIFGSPDDHKEGMRDARTGQWLEELLRDARLALRAMRRAPAFTLLVVLTLGLGIGAATAVWTLVDGIVLRPLSYADADRLHLLTEATPQGALRPPSYQSFLDWKREAAVADRMAFVRGEDVIVPDRDGPRRLLAAYVTDDFFGMFGVAAMAGRTFAGAGTERPAVLSWTMWQTQFGGDPNVVGMPLRTLDGVYTVTGVMPRSFREPAWADFWLPFEALPARSAYVRDQRNLHVDAVVVARLAPGVTRDRARTELGAIAERLARAYPEDAENWTVARLTGVRENVLGDAGARLRLLAMVVALVLLVTCINVAGLLVSRHTARADELALRAALGARRGRLMRQLLAESAMLAAAGAALGVLVASLGVEALRHFAPNVLPRLDEVGIGARALAFTVVVAGVATLLLGVLPARAALRRDVSGGFKRGSVGAARGGLRNALVVAQLALALCIAVGAGLLARTMARLGEVRLGMNPEGVIALRVIPPQRYDEAPAALELYRRLREEGAAVAGVQSVALANHIPFSGGLVTTKVVTDEAQAGEGNDQAVYRTVSPEYLQVLGGTMRRGRFLSDADLVSVGSGVVVNESFVRRFLSTGEAIGRPVTIFRMAQGRADLGTPITASVVGVMEDERIFGPAADAWPTIFIPYTWNAWPNMYLVARTPLPPPSVVPALRRAVLGVDPEIPIAGSSIQNTFRPLTAYLDGTLESRRLGAWALSVFSAVTLALAGVGIFGVMAYLVLQSTREIGLRLALGATPGGVRMWVLGQALRLAALGIAGGVLLAAGGVRLLRSQLAGVEPGDPIVYVSVAALFAAMALAAALIPAWRAARVDPMSMLRAE